MPISRDRRLRLAIYNDYSMVYNSPIKPTTTKLSIKKQILYVFNQSIDTNNHVNIELKYLSIVQLIDELEKLLSKLAKRNIILF